MKLPIITVLVVATALGGCARIAQSRLNPFNWFGHARPVVDTTLYTTPSDKRALIATVVTLKVEPYQGGAIVRATGIPPTQGYWDAELVAQPLDDKGRQVYEFRIFPPPFASPAGTPYSRQVVVAASISDIKLEGVKSIVVQGASNAMSVGR
ncbi:MAG: hypothetical protein ABI832_05960 [bacterium]